MSKKKFKKISGEAAALMASLALGVSAVGMTATKQAQDTPAKPGIQIVEGTYPEADNEGWVEVPDETAAVVTW